MIWIIFRFKIEITDHSQFLLRTFLVPKHRILNTSWERGPQCWVDGCLSHPNSNPSFLLAKDLLLSEEIWVDKQLSMGSSSCTCINNKIRLTKVIFRDFSHTSNFFRFLLKWFKSPLSRKSRFFKILLFEF